MNNENEHWLKLALEKGIYLNSLGVNPRKICQELYALHRENFWCLERKLLVELLVFEFAKREDGYYANEWDGRERW